MYKTNRLDDRGPRALELRDVMRPLIRLAALLTDHRIRTSSARLETRDGGHGVDVVLVAGGLWSMHGRTESEATRRIARKLLAAGTRHATQTLLAIAELRRTIGPSIAPASGLELDRAIERIRSARKLKKPQPPERRAGR